MKDNTRRRITKELEQFHIISISTCSHSGCKHGYDMTDEGNTENIKLVENNVNDKIDIWFL